MYNTVYLWNPEPPEGGESEPEDKICSKCLELVEECECQLYDELENLETDCMGNCFTDADPGL